MAETVAGLRDAVIQEASVDVSTSQALTWLNRSWRRMLVEARAYRRRVEMGPTVAGTAFYPIGSVVEVYNLTVGGVPYTRSKRGDAYSDTQGRLSWTYQGELGLFEPGADETAAGVTLIPAPESSGDMIEVFAARVPPDLTDDEAGDTLLQTVLAGEEVSEGLISGALAIAYAREGNMPLRDAMMNMFEADKTKLARTYSRRFRGLGPAQIRLA